MNTTLSMGQCATLACLLEASAPKPGNVHRGADFDDLTFTALLASAVAIGPAMDAAARAPLGKTILQAVMATRRLASTNTNLGTILLLAPLASICGSTSLKEGIATVLGRLTRQDCRDTYEAILLAKPGGLGRVDVADVHQTAPQSLMEAMVAAADRDLVARQYANNFEDLLGRVVPWLTEAIQRGWSLCDSIVHTHVRLMCHYPDSLIARKCGAAVAQQASRRAAGVLEAGEPGDEAYYRALADLDFWLRADHHRRNPGTTADFLAAGLFAALRDGIIEGPFR